MKYKVSKKQVQQGYKTIVAAPHLRLQTLLQCEKAEAYTERREGWAADVYGFDFDGAIVTGYAPFGNVKPSEELMEKYEAEAREICAKYHTFEEAEWRLNILARQFIDAAVAEHNKRRGK